MVSFPETYSDPIDVCNSRDLRVNHRNTSSELPIYDWSETIGSEYDISSASVHRELVARGCEVLLVSFICNVLLALGCPPTSPLNQRSALIEKLVFTRCCGWGGGGGGVISLPGSSTEPHHLAPNCLIT